MIAPVVIGFSAAVLVTLPRFLRSIFPGSAWGAPLFILGIAVVAMMVQRFVIDRRPGSRSYHGLADLFVHIHAPSNSDSSVLWMLRGTLSFFLTLFGGTVGPEGVAVEFGHGLAMRVRARSARWFEQRRRTDAATAIAAGIAAAFGAPFAAVLFPLELGIGGRTISVALGALVAFLGVRYFAAALPLERLTVEGFDLGGALYGFHFVAWKEWLGILAITVGAGLIGMLVIRFVRYSQEGLLDLFKAQTWMRTLAGGILLFLVVLVYKTGHAPSWSLLEQVLWSRQPTSSVLFLFFAQLMTLALVLSAFGSIGILWPIFALGGFFGYWVDHAIFQGIPGFSAAAGLAGGAAFWGAVLGTPLAGAVLAFEMTQNLSVLFPCLIAGFGARQVRIWFKTRSLIDQDLESRGVPLVQGRSGSVLDSVCVRDAMVNDHETVHEREPVSELYARLVKFRYPFIPVVNGQGEYIGLLTVDMVQEGWALQDPLASHSPLSKLLEAKDLLYRSRFKSPTVKASDRLSATSGLFNEIPCVPVLGEDGHVLGLLFVYNVRLAYDREVARKSLSFHQQRL